MSHSLSCLRTASIRPQMSTTEIQERVDSIKHLSTPYFPLEVVKIFVIEALGRAVQLNQVGQIDPYSSSSWWTMDLFVFAIRCTIGIQLEEATRTFSFHYWKWSINCCWSAFLRMMMYPNSSSSSILKRGILLSIARYRILFHQLSSILPQTFPFVLFVNVCSIHMEKDSKESQSIPELPQASSIGKDSKWF